MVGIKPKGKVKLEWSSNFAYALGLLASDGCLSKDGRHIDLTSKDTEQLTNYLKALDIKVNITSKHSVIGKKYQRVQFGDVLFYRFLVEIGFTPAKSKTIGFLKIPKQYFFDFLRGSFDGDGCFYSYFDPRWRSSFMFYVVFISASRKHIDWLQREIESRLKIKGHITKSARNVTFQLKYAKSESLELLPNMYYDDRAIHLSRKYQKIQKALKIEKKNNAQVEKLVNSLP
ncbi:MAG: LAGLIDADG family homing endonuclease [Candidatus Paceibacterota bacterium]